MSKTQCHRLELRGVKQRQKQREQGQGELVPGSELETPRSDHKFCLGSATSSSGVQEAALGAAGHLLLLVLPMEHSDFGFWAGSSRLLRLYASVYGAKAKTVNSISKHFNFTLTQEIHLSLKKPVAFTLWTTKGIPCG